jgi:hypothetical protein
MANTLLSYRLTCHSRSGMALHRDQTVIFAGPLSSLEQTRVRGWLHEHQDFIPAQVGLPSLNQRVPHPLQRASDRPWHEVLSMTPTARPPTEGPLAAFLARLSTVQWDVEAERRRLAQPHMAGVEMLLCVACHQMCFVDQIARIDGMDAYCTRCAGT